MMTAKKAKEAKEVNPVNQAAGPYRPEIYCGQCGGMVNFNGCGQPGHVVEHGANANSYH